VQTGVAQVPKSGPKYTSREPRSPRSSSPNDRCSGTCVSLVAALAITRTFIVSMASSSER